MGVARVPMTGKGKGRLIAAAAGIVAAGATFLWLRDRRRTETPDYAILASEGAIELRDYPALVVAETVQPGTRDRALGNGFGVLADYVFAETRGGEALPMTVPVMATPAGARGWRVRFVMPAGRGVASLPQPGEGVALHAMPSRRVAAIRFGGAANDRLLADKEAELRGWLAARGEVPVEPAAHAYYNSPMIPGPLRHSEVMIELADQKANEA